MFGGVETFVHFGRGHHEEQFCEIILNLNQVQKEIIAVFQRKTMSPQQQIESARMLTKIIISSLLCHKHNFGQNMKF